MKKGLLKLIGVALFIWVLAGVDRAELWRHLQNADWMLLSVAFALQFLIYAAKTVRWHVFVRSTGLHPSLWQSWQLFNIGIVLANITPGKLGELGKAAYLLRAGLPKAQSVAVVIADRLFDIAVILLIAILSVGLLFGWAWSLALLAIASLALPLVSWLLITSSKAREALELFGLQTLIPSLRTMSSALLATLISWSIYFAWAVLVARSVDITIPVHLLVAAFTITGILSLLPVAPSGLGTRELALLTLLAPYGIEPSKTVALSMLMLASILLSCLLGGWYALRSKTLFPPSPAPHEQEPLDITGRSRPLG